MIEFDYLIERNETDEVKQYRPEHIPKKLPGLVRIEAPNSSGKSTLLNIIAAGFYGHKDDSLNKDLRNKINSLIKSEHQKVTFELQLFDSKNNMILRSKKNSANIPEIDLFRIEGGAEQRISKEIFEKQYNLIYDIPDNPISRLNQLINEVQEIQREYGYRVREGSIKLKSIIQELKDSRDEGTIEKKKNELREIDEAIEENEKQLTSLRPGMEKLKKYWASYYYSLYQDLFEKKKKEEYLQRDKVKNFSKDQEDVEKGHFKNELKLTKELGELDEHHRDIYDLMNIFLESGEKNNLKSWMNISFSEISDSLQIPESISKDLRYFKSKLLDFDRNRELKKSASDAKIITDLINVLEEYKKSGNRIPNIDIDYLIEEINKQKSDKEGDYNFSKLLSQVNSTIGSYEKLKNQIERKTIPIVYSSRKDFKSKDPEGSERMIEQKKLLDIRRNKDEYERFVDDYLSVCLKLDINREQILNTLSELKNDQLIKGYQDYSERALKESINKLEDEIFNTNQIIKGKESIKPIVEKELERLEKMEPHRYQARQVDINSLFTKYRTVEQKLLQNYDKYLKQVKNKMDAGSEEEENYRIAISHYLANRIGNIRHLDNSYTLESVDLPRGTIKTNSGKEIRLDDMGTGQTQSAYLMGLLGSEDNRKIIALFDEVSTMDSKSISNLQNRMRDLYERDKLVLGIIVQPADEAKIVPF